MRALLIMLVAFTPALSQTCEPSLCTGGEGSLGKSHVRFWNSAPRDPDAYLEWHHNQDQFTVYTTLQCTTPTEAINCQTDADCPPGDTCTFRPALIFSIRSATPMLALEDTNPGAGGDFFDMGMVVSCSSTECRTIWSAWRAGVGLSHSLTFGPGSLELWHQTATTSGLMTYDGLTEQGAFVFSGDPSVYLFQAPVKTSAVKMIAPGGGVFSCGVDDAGQWACTGE